MATEAKTPKLWRAPDAVRALNPNNPTAAEASISATLDDARATLDRLRAGSAALANRRAAAEREADDVRGLAGIGQATDAEATEAAHRADACRAAEEAHAEGVATAEERVSELDAAAKLARLDASEAFDVAMDAEERTAHQALVNAVVEASRCLSVLYDIRRHRASFLTGAYRTFPQHDLLQEIRADSYTLRDWLEAAEKKGFAVPELPHALPGFRGYGMIDP